MSANPPYRLRGRLDARALAQSGGQTHLNLAAVRFCDLAGMRDLAAYARTCHESGALLHLHHIPPALRALLLMARFDTICIIHSSQECETP